MKISLSEKGLAIAVSETIQESIRLQEMFIGTSAKKVGRPIGSLGHKKDKGANAWAGKHRKPCQICGKYFKNMKLHMLIKHTKEYKDLYGAETSTGKLIGETYSNV